MGAIAKQPGPLGRAVQEVLESLLSPALSRQVFTDALERAGRSAFPEDPVEAAEFVNGPLSALVQEVFGTEEATFVVDHLAPVLSLATSGVRARPRVPAPTARPTQETARPTEGDPYSSPTRPAPIDDAPARRSDRVEVLLTSATPSVPDEVTRALGGAASLSLVQDAFELFTRIEMRSVPVWIVVDGHRPSVDVETLAAFLKSLPTDCRVLLWGCDSPAAERIVRQRPGRWSMLRAAKTWGELVTTLRAMIGER